MKIERVIKFSLILAFVICLTACQGSTKGMLDPKGFIALHERKLFFDTLALMLIVVLPVIVMSFTFVYHYQVSHRIRDYKPNWSHSYFLESLWWGIPCAIIVVLAFLTWKRTHQLDPNNQIIGRTEKPMQIQVIALPWKWLFIYPEQHIASVNYLVIPVGQQVEYLITTDNVPMSAFFIPQLGSQIYTMTGMQTRLFLVADKPGDFEGMNTMFNGDGFSDMHFVAHAAMPDEMNKWFADMKKSPDHLTEAAYNELLKPTVGDKPKFYSEASDQLFENVMHLYMNSTGPTHPRAQMQNSVK